MGKSNRHINLKRTGKSDLVFKGKEIAAVTTNPDGKKPRWTVIKLFKTISGIYVTQVLGKSTVDGEVTRSRVDFADTPEDIPNILGFGYLAKQLYEKIERAFEQRL